MPSLVETPAQVTGPAAAKARLSPLEHSPRFGPPSSLLQTRNLSQVPFDGRSLVGLLNGKPLRAAD